MSLKSSQKRSNPDFSLEIASGLNPVCGIDEVGRGPLAGPVIAAAVMFESHDLGRFSFLSEINDSKKLTERKREALFDLIMAHAHVGVGEASVEEIDRINILQASLLAMSRAYQMMGKSCALALVDGNKAPPLTTRVQTVIKGDSRSLSIAAASIVAKVTRDRLMRELDGAHPYYGWASNAGYGSAKHLAALQEYGICDHHRKSFSPVRLILEKSASRVV
ncbi:MAG: ribonuclease HII [Pseudobdellovibrionaceae bacterium]